MQVSKYISEEEYRCPHCHQFPVGFDSGNLNIARRTILYGFDAIRVEWGKPLPISRGGGYRCATHNQLINGAPLSAHQCGVALDIDVNSVDEVERLAQLIESLFPDFRRGEYTARGTFVHIDAAYLIQPRATLLWNEGRRWYD